MATSAPAKFRIDVSIHNLLMNSPTGAPAPPKPKGMTLPEPVFPQHPELLKDPGPDIIPDHRDWTRAQIWRKVRGWLIPYVRSRVMPGDFHPITAYLFLDYKCNLDCWYCWSYNNKIKGMTEDTARRAIDWLHDNGCRVLGLMGGEPLLRPDFAHKVAYYAAKKGFWIYVGTNGRLLRPEVADRLGDAGVAVYNFALDAWDEVPGRGLPKALVPVQKNLEYLVRKQYVYGHMVFFNINICRNNHEDVKRITEYARAHHLATDYHLNETPMLEQDEHFKHLNENPTYIRPEDWRGVDELIDWIIEKNKAGYQMVNSVHRLQEMKAFVRMSSGVDLKKYGWYGDGGAENIDEILATTPGIVREENGDVHFTDWNCRAGQNNVIIRTDGTVAPCFPMYPSSFDWGNIDGAKFDSHQLTDMKKTCQHHCFSTLNHNLGYCYNDARVIKWLWKQAVTNKFKGGARSFED
ncbi:MAG TPA: radical SAM protein [Terriglobales bacterium]|nr:radical SAM domain heme biosynthesis protein [uncultured bacterium]HMC72801.1 radical SAM protein [Terriglobales bacterium]